MNFLTKLGKKTFLFYVFLAIFFLLFISVSNESVSAGETKTNDCLSISRAQDVLRCALVTHPDVARAKSSSEQAVELESIAGQIPNPELDGGGTYGKSLGDTVVESEASLLFTLELGGKRGARVDHALAQQEYFKVRLQSTAEKTAIETVLKLHHFRQVLEELSVVEEGLTTFSKIQKRYRRRIKLSPEQQVSLGVFDLAKADYQLQLSRLEQERSELEEFFKAATPIRIDTVVKHLPSRKKQWPTAPENRIDLAGTEIKLATSKLKVATMDLERERSNSWPDLKIGPTVQFNSEGGVSYPAYGVSMSVPLPVFNTNSGGRAYAAKGLASAKQNLDLKNREIDLKRKKLLAVYNSSVRALKNSPSVKEVDRKHRNIERLFFKGVISSSLVIEAHRQILEVIKNQNDQEIKALQALWGLYALNGTILQEEI